MMSVVAVVLAVITLRAVADLPPPTVSAEVQTANGPIVGFNRFTHESRTREVSTFRGIPFAAPPTGQNRFRAPQPLTEKWTQPRQMVNFSKTCPQSAFSPMGYGTVSKSPELASEDCLYLNVHAPAESVGASPTVPVMIWLFGGGYVTGDGFNYVFSKPLFDGANLVARHGTIIVTLNYRLCSMGFWASDELKAEDPDGSTGNQAVRDQRAGMQWVQDNIAGFGGDPKQVTLFGESAGAFSVFWHLVSPPSWPLFHRAISESGVSKLNWFFQPYEHYSKDFYVQWAERVGCPSSGVESLPCLRKVSMWDLVDPPVNMSAGSPLYDRYNDTLSMPFGPTIDGSTVGLTGTPLDLIRAGRFHKVPFILGANLDEGTIFKPLAIAYTHQKTMSSMDNLKKTLAWTFGEDKLDTILAAYPESQFKDCDFPWCSTDYAQMFERMVRDVGFDCSNRNVAEAWAGAGLPVWMYKFAWNPTLWSALKDWTMGVSHGFEVPFVWRFSPVLDKLRVTLTDPWIVANDISCRWSTFAFASSPNGNTSSRPLGCPDKSLGWPQYNHDSRNYYAFHSTPMVNSVTTDSKYPEDEFASDRRCDMWTKLLDNNEFPWPTVGPKKATTGVKTSSEAVLV